MQRQPHSPVCLDMPSMQRLFRQTERKKSSDSTVRKAIQQHFVEHAERNKALQTVIHCIQTHLQCLAGTVG